MQSYKKTLILIAVMLAGCQKSLFPGGPRYIREPGGISSGSTDTHVDSAGRTLYITSLCGDEAVLFASGRELVRAPASPDPERHRTRQGHLWTDVIQGKETVVFRDGKEWLRFPGEELFAGFLLVEGSLHTLGQRPGNQGFCYRIDGKEIFSSPSGRIVGSITSREWDAGAFCADSSGVFYTYAIPFVHSGGATTWEYRIMKGPDTVRIIPDDISGTILDLRVYRGKVYMVALRGRRLCLICGADILWYRWLGDTETLLEVGLAPYHGEMGLKGVSSFGRFNYSEAWFQLGGRMLRYHESMNSVTPFVLAKGSVLAFWTRSGDRLTGLELNGRVIPIDYGKYSLHNPLCINAFDDTFVAVLSDTSSTEHLVLTDTLSTQLRFSGIPTSIRIE